MDQLVKVRDGEIIAAEINIIKDQTRRQILVASIEIGQLLCEAKELVPHGDWQSWLEQKVEYSQSTANNFMRIYREYGSEQIGLLGSSKSQAFENLTYSQAVALFALPADEREGFVAENDVENMSTRQLQEAIKRQKDAETARDEALAERDKANNEFLGAQKLLAVSDKKITAAQAAQRHAEAQIEDIRRKMEEDTQRLNQELEEAKSAASVPSDEDLAALREAARLEAEKEYAQRIELLTAEKKTNEAQAAEKVAALEKKLKSLKIDKESIAKKKEIAEKAAAVATPEAQQYMVRFEDFQRNFNDLTMLLTAMHEARNEMAPKFAAALRKIIGDMDSQIEALLGDSNGEEL